jgi:predicted alpha/beta hydrolase family esterase
MPKNVVLLHGTCSEKAYYDENYPSLSNSHWFPWLQRQLLMRGIATATPDMVNAHQPDYPVWKHELERFDRTPDTVLVGHSCGGGFLVRWLSEHKDVRVRKVILVAPWLDPDGTLDSDFFAFTIDPDLVSRTTKGITVYNSDDDFAAIQTSVENLTATVPDVKVVDVFGYGHFVLNHMGTEQFPELLAECLAD